MSKIASKPIQIPESIKFVINENLINIEGPMGKLSFEKHSNITVDVKDGFVQVKTEDADCIPLSGTTRASLSVITPCDVETIHIP